MQKLNKYQGQDQGELHRVKQETERIMVSGVHHLLTDRQTVRAQSLGAKYTGQET